MTRTITALVLITITAIFIGCSKDDSVNPNPNPNQNSINLEDAKLNKFPLFGITPVSINITQPIIVNNKETVVGKIDIVVPNTVSLNAIASSITSNELNLSKFAILPGNSTMLNYEAQGHVHTIVNVLDNSEELLHYTVNIKKEAAPQPEILQISSFKFEKSKNPALTADIEAEKIGTESGWKQIFIFVPPGTDLTNLIPTITFKGTHLLTTLPNLQHFGEYVAGTPVDFKYPKRFPLVVQDASLSNTVQYDVIVDVKNPIKFVTNPLVINNIAKNKDFFGAVGTFINQGNHLLTSFAPTYKNKIPMISNGINIGLISLTIPGGGLKPGESSDIKFSLNKTLSSQLPVGAYKFTSVHPPGFTEILSWPLDAEKLLLPSELDITVNLVD